MQPSYRQIRVLVADDSRTALRSVCEYLEFEGRFDIVGTAVDGAQAVFKAERLRPELLLADLSMPQKTGLEVAKELRRSFPELRILIFTGLNGACLQDECLRWGADGFVEKSRMPEGLMEEIRRLFPQISEEP